jgi:hypothetical protein
MQGKAAYIRSKVVGPNASGSYMHWAALFCKLYEAHKSHISVAMSNWNIKAHVNCDLLQTQTEKKGN